MLIGIAFLFGVISSKIDCSESCTTGEYTKKTLNRIF